MGATVGNICQNYGDPTNREGPGIRRRRDVERGFPAAKAASVATAPPSVMSSQGVDTRLDKWLWAARIFKTRQLAVKAINGGHVEVNGQRAKPSKPARVGDEILVRKGPYTFSLVIDGLSDRRGPPRVAQTLYTESEESVNERERLSRELKSRASQVLYDAGRPDPRTQREARARKRAQH